MISEELKQKLKDNGQFPYGKRDRAYQSIDGNHLMEKLLLILVVVLVLYV
jgi:hypothetical protein